MSEQLPEAPPVSGRARFVTASDGLRLHAREYGDAPSRWTPVVCLPGLTRTHRDFEDLAGYLSRHRERPRRVVAIDYRGRGGSGWDHNRENYTPAVEMADAMSVMTALGIPSAAIVGTSRGGIIGMFMGVHHPNSVAAMVLVDIGPEVEPLGLARIKSYVGRTPPPVDWADAAELMRRVHGGHFTAWGEREWNRFARMTFAERDGKPVTDYDPRLAETLERIDFDKPVPQLWSAFAALSEVPMMAIRGGNSDLLSPATLERMVAEHPGMTTWVVEDEGHPPLLRGEALLERMAAFLATVDGGSAPGTPEQPGGVGENL